MKRIFALVLLLALCMSAAACAESTGAEKYAELIGDCLAAGVPMDVIGIQSHRHTGHLLITTSSQQPYIVPAAGIGYRGNFPDLL